MDRVTRRIEEAAVWDQDLCWLSDHGNQMAWLRWLAELCHIRADEYMRLVERYPRPLDSSRMIQFQGRFDLGQPFHAEFKYWMHRGLAADDLWLEIVALPREDKDGRIAVLWPRGDGDEVLSGATQFGVSLLDGLAQHSHLPVASADLYLRLLSRDLGCERANMQAAWICSQAIMLQLTKRRLLLENRPAIPSAAPAILPQEPTPCPYCGEPLRTPKAKQCRFCRMDWHDPENVYRRD